MIAVRNILKRFYGQFPGKYNLIIDIQLLLQIMINLEVNELQVF
jgi:hypothetical protein